MNEITIKTEIPLNTGYLAQLLGHYENPEIIFDLFRKNASDGEKIVHNLAKDFIRDVEATVSIRSIEFAYFDCRNITYGLAYFTAIISGTGEELVKVVGDGKLFLRYDR
jgi:hypothetical protein